MLYRNILQEELPSFLFLANNHSNLTMHNISNISFTNWCKEYNLWYEGWCNDTCYWNPFDITHSPGFLFFDLEENKNIWIHGWGSSKEEILSWIYTEKALNERFPNLKRDISFKKEPFSSFKNFALSVFLQTLETPNKRS